MDVAIVVGTPEHRLAEAVGGYQDIGVWTFQGMSMNNPAAHFNGRNDEVDPGKIFHCAAAPWGTALL